MTAPFHKTNHNSPAPQYTMSSKTFIKQEPVPVFYFLRNILLSGHIPLRNELS